MPMQETMWIKRANQVRRLVLQAPIKQAQEQSSCDDADAGYYVSSTGQASQTACAAGTYQSSTGQPSCDDADAGYYVPSSGSNERRPLVLKEHTKRAQVNPRVTMLMQEITFQPNSSNIQTACAVGTYQSSTGQSSCDDADAGYYV